MCLLLAQGLEDAFPDAKKAAAAGLAALARKLPHWALEDNAERLLQVCLLLVAVLCCAVDGGRSVTQQKAHNQDMTNQQGFGESS
jgi:hypothetical protein